MELISTIFFFIIIIPSAILHEYMHGWVADRLGDPTARYAGRLTLNPRAHVELWGTFLLPLLLFLGTGGRFLFAYAKPVPYNPFNLRDQRWGPVAVAVAGPLSNFALAAAFGAMVQFSSFSSELTLLLSTIVYANVVLGVFNLVPIPPLDGSKVLYAVMPESWHQLRLVLDRFGSFFLLIFIIFFFHLLQPIMTALFVWFTGGHGVV